MEEQLESDRGEWLRQRLARVPSGGSKVFEAVQLGDGESWYCELKHARVETEAETGPIGRQRVRAAAGDPARRGHMHAAASWG